MDVNQFNAVVVSAFGRGHWLAAEFQRQKMNVLLVDVTARMGPWPVEDGEGPFGAVRMERFEQSFSERLNNDDPVETVENGWTLWLADGPIEFKGPLTRFHAERNGWPAGWLESLARGEKIKDVNPQWPFSRTWPLAFAHQLAATRYRPAVKALEGGRPAPLTANFGLRFATRQGLGRSLDWLRSRGVTVTDKSEVLDLSMRGRGEISGLELKGEIAGLARGDYFVWTLTGGETRFLGAKLGEKLYPGGIVEPEWCWIRYRLSVDAQPEIGRLPLHMLVVGDIECPWTHDNLIALLKTPSPDRMDAWIRIPAGHRFHRAYLQEHGDRVLAALSKRLPSCRFEIQSLPQEASYTSQDLGEPRLPVWADDAKPWAGRRKLPNLAFESPENRENHTLDCEFDHQKILRDQVVRWWEQKLLKAAKEKAK